MRSLIIAAVLFLALPASSPSAPDAPKPPVCIDARPAYIWRVTKAIAKWENCPHNAGCLKFAHQVGAHLGRNGYAEWSSDEESMQALYRHVEKRQAWSLGRMLGIYNSANSRYAEVILRGTGLDPGLVIAEQTDCGGDQ